MLQEKLEIAGLEFVVENRSVGPDEGATVRVYGAIEGKRVEVLRFDCFRKNPHYHYDPQGKNIQFKLDPVTMGNPVHWSLHQIATNLPAMLRHAGYETLAERIDSGALAPVVPRLRAAMRGAASCG